MTDRKEQGTVAYDNTVILRSCRNRKCPDPVVEGNVGDAGDGWGRVPCVVKQVAQVPYI